MLHPYSLLQVLLVPRFGVTQGVKDDGTAKVRAVDHFSWSHAGGRKKRKRAEVKSASVNGHYSLSESIKHDHLDDLHAAMKCHHEVLGEVCTCVKHACGLPGRACLCRCRVFGRPTLMQPSGEYLSWRRTSGLPLLRICARAWRGLLCTMACRLGLLPAWLPGTGLAI